jgi:hypothetical protein
MIQIEREIDLWGASNDLTAIVLRHCQSARLRLGTKLRNYAKKTGDYVNSWLICPSSPWVELVRQPNLKSSRLVPQVNHACCAHQFRSLRHIGRNAPASFQVNNLAVGYNLSSTIRMMPPAVAAEVTVDPTGSMTDGWTPERRAENSADNPSGDRTNRASDHKACTCSRSGANHVATGHGRNRRDCDYGCYCK